MTLEELVGNTKAALLIVDMQNDYCHPDGVLARNGNDIGLIQRMAPRLRAFLGQARDASLPIIHIRTHHSPWTNSKAWLSRSLGTTPRLHPDSWGADWYEGIEPRFHDAWSPDGHEYTVTKHRYSAFVDTDLDLILRSQGIETLIMTGEATNVCVESTARDGYMKDYFIVFVSDCTATGSEQEHEATLRNMHKHFGVVASADEIVGAWRRLGKLKEGVSA
ncbi:MAG: cysteine hydrolase family protein [Chloroflexota bacterium]